MRNFSRTERKLLVQEARQAMTSPHAWAVIKYIREHYPKFWDKHRETLDPEVHKVYHHLDSRYVKSVASIQRRDQFLMKLQVFFFGRFECEHCGSQVCELRQVPTFPHSHSRWCSQSCSKANEEATVARETTCLGKYGYKNVTLVPQIKVKQKDSWSKVDRVQVLEKRNATLARKHGSVEAATADRIAKAGVTNLGLYGNLCPIHGKEPRKKCLKTWKTNLGVDNPSKNPEVYDKITESRMKKRKKVRCGNRTHLLQGYEPQALEFLVTRLKLKPKDIWSQKKVMPEFWWSNPKVKSGASRYYPDFMLRSPANTKWFVEVKSSWTLGLDTRAEGSGNYFEDNRKKMQATVDRFPMIVFVDGILFRFKAGSKIPSSSFFRREIKHRASEAHSLSLRSLSKVVLLD